MIRLVGIDVDGTLVGSSAVVDPRVWNAAERARDAGIRLVLCTGRPAFGLALDYAKELAVNGWHIFQNGASIIDLASGKTRSTPLPTAWVKTLVAQARASGEVLELYSDDEYVVEIASAWARAHAQILGVPFETRRLESLTEPIVRAQWLLAAGKAAQTLATAHPGLEMAQSTSPLMPETRFIGLTHEDVSKGSALRLVAAEYEVELRDVMYVGDAG